MSVVEITELAPPEFSDVLASGATATRKLQAICDSVNDGPVTIRAHASCPKKGSTYTYKSESDPTLVCTSLNITPRADNNGFGGSKCFDITATYTNSVNTASAGEDEENPLDDPPVVEFSFTTFQRPAEFDLDGIAVATGAGEPFDPPWMMDEHRPIIIITRNEPTFSGTFAQEWQDAVNEDAFAGAEPGTAKLSVSARKETRGEYTFWVVTYEIEFKWEKWIPTKLLARGYRYRKEAGKPAENYIDPKTNQQPSEPIWLKLDGTKYKTLNDLKAENNESPVDGGDEIEPYAHEFRFYRWKTFGDLFLDI